MIQFATIDEAWGASSPPPRVPQCGAAFDVGSDAPMDTNFCSKQALESAYPATPPAAEDYKRMSGTRSRDTLALHAPRTDPACPPQGILGEGTPGQQYNRTWPPNGDLSGSNADQQMNSPDPKLPSVQTPPPIAGHSGSAGPPSSQNARERSALYDILLFVLFGVLLILVMDQFVSVGEGLGRMRTQAMQSNLFGSARLPTQFARSGFQW